jgi:hypothetical protein
MGNSVAQAINYYQQRHEEASQLDKTILQLGEMKGPDDKPILDKKALERVRGFTDKERYANEKAWMQAFQFRNQLMTEGAKIEHLRAQTRAASGEMQFYTAPDGTKYFYGARGWQRVGGQPTAASQGVSSRFQVKEIDKQVKDIEKEFSEQEIPDPGMMLDSKRHYGGTQDAKGVFTRGADPSKYTHTGVDTDEGAPVVFPNSKFKRLQQRAQELQKLRNQREQLLKSQSGVGGGSAKVRVRLSDGRTGWVPSSQLPQWQSQGATVIGGQQANTAPPQDTEEDEDTDDTD